MNEHRPFRFYNYMCNYYYCYYYSRKARPRFGKWMTRVSLLYPLIVDTYSLRNKDIHFIIIIIIPKSFKTLSGFAPAQAARLSVYTEHTQRNRNDSKTAIISFSNQPEKGIWYSFYFHLASFCFLSFPFLCVPLQTTPRFIPAPIVAYFFSYTWYECTW